MCGIAPLLGRADDNIAVGPLPLCSLIIGIEPGHVKSNFYYFYLKSRKYTVKLIS
jgi:hypothetical protein